MSSLKAHLMNNSSSNIRLNSHGSGNVPHWRSALAQPAGDFSRYCFSCPKFYTLGHFAELLTFISTRGTWCQPWPRSLRCHSPCHELCAGNSAQFTKFGWISGWFQHVTPHSRQGAAGAVLAALRATFLSVTKKGAAAAGKCGVSSISAWVPPSWPREGEEQLFFWLLPAWDARTGRGWKCWKVVCNRGETQAAEMGILGIWEFSSLKSWKSDGGPAVFEEELDGNPVP